MLAATKSVPSGADHWNWKGGTVSDDGAKRCTKCGGSGPFAKNKSRKDGLQAWCKTCLLAANNKDPDRVRAVQSAAYKRDADRRKAVARKWLADNPDRAKSRRIRYYSENKALAVAAWSRRRARLAGLASTLTPDQWASIVEYFGHRCAYCLRDGLVLTVDHLIPISRGGPNVESNVVPACERCNKSKNDRLIFYMLNRDFYRCV